MWDRVGCSAVELDMHLKVEQETQRLGGTRAGSQLAAGREAAERNPVHLAAERQLETANRLEAMMGLSVLVAQSRMNSSV